MQKNISALDLAIKLIQINSVTPSRMIDARTPGEQDMAQFLYDYLTPQNFHCELIPVKDNRPNFIARHDSYDPDLPTLALEAHLDTVDVENMSIDPFAADIRDDRLYGRGACDTKGTMAVMITAMLDWYRKQPDTFNLIFIGTMGEELGTIGAKALIKTKPDLQMVLVGEPTHCVPVVVHNGLWRFKLLTHGRACHSSTPHEGENAIEKIRPIFNYLLTDFKPLFEKVRGNTFSITQFQGGVMMNIVPDRCSLTIDARYGPETDLTALKKSLFEQLEHIDIYHYEEIQSEPAFRSKGVLLYLMDKALYDLGIESVHGREPWFSDAAHFSQANYDCVVWGAGSIQQAHTRDEFVSIKQLHKALQILNRMLIHCKAYFYDKQKAT